MASKPRLTYLDGRGFSECIRIALSAAQIQFDEVYLRSKDEFLQLIKDGKLLFKQVPLLEIDGQTLVGSEPIVRYVCRKGKLEGKTEADQTKIEVLSMGARDMLKAGLVGAKFQSTPEAQEAMLQKGVKQSVERYLPVFEKELSESKSGFLVGDSVSMADIFLFDSITYLYDDPALKPKLADFPKCTAFIEHFSQQPGVKEYMASPSRHPPPDDAYVKEVMLVLH